MAREMRFQWFHEIVTILRATLFHKRTRLRRLGHILGNGSVTQMEMARDLAHGQVQGMYLVDLLWRQHGPEAVYAGTRVGSPDGCSCQDEAAASKGRAKLLKNGDSGGSQICSW
jgi:hypothetical protein